MYVVRTNRRDEAMSISRRGALALPLWLAACGGGGTPPANYPSLSFDYLSALKIDVARIDIDDNWAPRGAARHVEYLAPETPRAALVQMARDRLVTVGSKGVASFVIEDASIIQGARSYELSMAVRFDVADEGGNRLGGATARVSKVQPARDDGPQAVRQALYDLVRDGMRDMNVEFEYQVKLALKSMLEATNPTVAAPAKVQSEDLSKEPQLVPLTP